MRSVKPTFRKEIVTLTLARIVQTFANMFLLNMFTMAMQQGAK